MERTMFKLDQEFVDTRTGNIATIVDIVNNNKGTLYTVQYGDSEYRRYYDYKFEKFFAEICGETYNTEDISHNNVTFMDFTSKSKFANYTSWLSWLKLP